MGCLNTGLTAALGSLMQITLIPQGASESLTLAGDIFIRAVQFPE